MWQALSLGSQNKAQFADEALELAQATMRRIIVSCSILCGLVLLYVPLARPKEFVWNLAPAVMLCLVASVLAYWLVNRSLPGAEAVWQVGMSVVAVICVVATGLPDILFLLMFLPLMSSVTLGAKAGLVSEGLLLATALGLPRIAGIPGVGMQHQAGLAFGGLLGLVTGWASTQAFYTIIGWLLYSQQEAQRNLTRAHDHRAQLLSLSQNLDHAYYLLERSNASLVAAWRAADAAERFKADFVANVSHELRTPLNLIIGFSELMVLSPESYGDALPGPYRNDVKAIYNSARHLMALVDDVLDLGRIDAGKIPLACTEVSAAGLVMEVASMVRDYISAKGLSLQVAAPPDLPALWIDPLRIRQVLLNLVVNAARFTERGFIRLEAEAHEGEIIFRVIDTGRGIPAQELPHIFDMFHLSSEPVDGKWHAGSGLGLPISKRFVELHHGRMSAESIPGKGSTFWFTLPIGAGPVLGTYRGEPARTRPVVMLGSTERIVVVCAGEGVVGLLQRHLEGLKLVRARDPQEGVSLAESLKAVAIAVDSVAGAEALGTSLPVISFAWPTSQRVAAALGAVDYLAKPVSQEQLFAAIDRLGRPINRILIADDDPELVRLFRRMLQARLPIQDCLRAYDGDEALQIIRSARPDLVLLDLSMPKVSGQRVIEALAADPDLGGIAVIAVSGRGWDDLAIELRGPIQVHRTGGFQLGEVVKTLEAVLNVLSTNWTEISATAPEPTAAPPV